MSNIGVAAYPRTMAGQPLTSSSHWGAFQVSRTDDGAQRHRSRVARPSIRRRSAGRGYDSYEEVGWDDALDLVAEALRDTRARYGDSAIFGGSYGWASAGRFHHAQSQLHRFLALGGGYTRSRNTYSFGASEVVLPHIAGKKGAHGVLHQGADWPVVSISPLRDDLPPGRGQWLPIRPGTDVALMFALAHQLVADGQADLGFLERFTEGGDRFLASIADRTPAWAAEVCGVPEATIVELARSMAAGRTFVTVSWSLQRARHGEQPTPSSSTGPAATRSTTIRI